MSKKLRINKIASIIVSLVILVSLIHLDLIFHVPFLRGEQVGAISFVSDSQGITVTLPGEFELYFNATNGAEITGYYDLKYDPYRNNNLVLPSNQGFQPSNGTQNLSPLFCSGLYDPFVPNFKVDSTTGGDPNATLAILGSGTQNGTDYVILQATARIMDVGGGVFEDVHGNTIYVKSTWLIRSDGKMFVERTLYIPDYVVMPANYNWYPFYCIRTNAFDVSATYYLFNTTYAYTYSVTRQTYQENWTALPELPSDNTGYFGIAGPFSSADGTNNIVLAYDLGLSNISEWKSDTFQSDKSGYGGDEFGAVHEFTSDCTITTQTYHAMIVLTHDPISENSIYSFAQNFSANPVFPITRPDLTTNKVYYENGEPFIVNVSATIDYNMANIDKTLILTDESGRTLWQEDFGVVNASQGESWPATQLLDTPLSAMIASGTYTFTFSLVSELGIVVGSSSTDVIVTFKAHQFGKTMIGTQTAISYADYKETCRYSIPEDGWVTSISMWFGSQDFEAKVAVYTHPEGILLLQSQSEAINSTGWHNFTVPRTFLFSGFYGLAWKTSVDAVTAYDNGTSSDQTARTPELYDYSFSPTFGTPQFYPLAESIYATYDPVSEEIGVSNNPQAPSYDQNVTILAYAADGGVLCGPVTLSYSTSANANWISIPMLPGNGAFTAQIPSQRYNTVVYYTVTALDARGNSTSSGMQSFVVGDFQPPVISYLDRSPVSPNYNDSVVISARVSEPLDASGVAQVILSYWNGMAWANTTMSLNITLYTGTIPSLPLGASPRYIVYAFDNAQNVAVSDVYSYTVASAPTAKIDGLNQTSVSGVVPVTVTGSAANFDRMELYISGQLVQTWNQPGPETYNWDTASYLNGSYLVMLVVYNKAGNTGSQEVLVNVNNSGGVVNVTPHNFGKTDVGQHQNATTYADYKMVCRYLMPEDGWVTSISMWFGSQDFEAKVAIYTHPEGKLLVQSQSEAITSIGWHNFTVPRTFLSSGFYGLAWKTSVDAVTAYDNGTSSDQTARTPELYSYSFSLTFGTPQFYPIETSIYATYDLVLAKVGMSNVPQTPSYEQNVTIMAYATEGGILAGPVVLNYSTSANDLNWFNISMIPDNGLYTAQIPPQRYNTVVYYKVTAQDGRGNSISAGTHSYKVGDFQPPTISYLERTPVDPSYNETVVISARVSEPPNASDVGLAVLNYWNGSAWTNITMTLRNALYTAPIPSLPFGTAVNYTVWASNYAQNVAVSDIYSYTVTDKYPPMAEIYGLTQTSLEGIVPVNVTGNDANFEKMELYISGRLVQTWNQSSSEIYYLDTTKYPDGSYLVKLMVYDKADNIGEKEILVSFGNNVPGWTLSLIAVVALIVVMLIVILVYSARRRKERGQFHFHAVSLIKNRAVKLVVRLALILSALWYGYWIAAEILVRNKPLENDLMTLLINDVGFAFALLLLLLHEVLQRRLRTKSTQT
jgi:hypothetical protein